MTRTHFDFGFYHQSIAQSLNNLLQLRHKNPFQVQARNVYPTHQLSHIFLWCFRIELQLEQIATIRSSYLLLKLSASYYLSILLLSHATASSIAKLTKNPAKA